MGSTDRSSTDESFDCIIIGAGISGINCAFRLKSQIPDASYVILEARSDIGGTWDQWKYPGVRCDSDISTIAFSWHDFAFPGPIISGPAIQDYLRQASTKAKIDENIRLNHKVTSAEWSRESQNWHISADNDSQPKRFTSRFLVLAAGFLNYDTSPEVGIPNISQFKGRVINPQFWPQDYDWTNDRIAVIGSGATAVSLIPAITEKAAHVSMIQRSPSYVAKWDNGPSWAHKYLPLSFVYKCRRLWCAIRLQLFVNYCKKYPQAVIDFLRADAKKILPARIDYDVHFKPRYKPWDQRMCVDSDCAFFKSLSLPNVDITTGSIDTITEQGIRMQDGKTIEADTIVAATGFRMQIDGGIRMRVDGQAVSWNDKFVWNGTMVSGVPNMVFMLGYPNNSWTLGIDESAFVLVRLMQHMQSCGARSAVPQVSKDTTINKLRLWNLNSTYRVAAESRLPVHGDKGPWKPRDAPAADWIHSRWGNITNGLEFIE
ncbi:hypothetical protein E8E14_013669 [Neopestalotiopsis sp. 37M]|nr:hypothetical protein E8E14_013669 [Neopestalotiopsis sp. 37M]